MLDHLLSPLTIRGKTYKNRITSPPNGPEGFVGKDGSFNEHDLKTLLDRTNGGFASVTIGETSVNGTDAPRFEGSGTTDFHELSGPRFEGWKRVLSIAKSGGNLVLIQLSHCGSTRSNLPMNTFAVGPDAYTAETGCEVRAMTKEDIRRVCGDFAQAAYYLKAAGADGVMVHAAHGWLPSQFLSARTNHRKDEYGGSLDNRCRFPVEIIKAIREKVGEDFIIEVRVSGAERCRDGQEMAETARFCELIDGIADIINVSSGAFFNGLLTRMYSNYFDPHFVNLPQASYIRKRTKHLKITLVGGVNDPEAADRYIAEGLIDFIALGRQGMCDTNFARKCIEGRPEDILRCARCMRCMGGQDLKIIDTMQQLANPDAITDGPPPMMPSFDCPVNSELNVHKDLSVYPEHPEPKKVLVVGGGPAGLQAALTAAERGHSVTLCEKTAYLGGLMRYTDNDCFKEDLRYRKDQLIRWVKEAGVEILLETPCTPELIAEKKPDAVIVAVGSKYRAPSVKGGELAVNVSDMYFGAPVGDNVVVMGGGETGCEAAIWLADQGKHVILLSRSPIIVKNFGKGYREILEEQFGKFGVDCRKGCAVTRITPDDVAYVDADGNERLVAADTVISATGTVADTETMEAILAMTGDIPTQTIGDCVKARSMNVALGEAIEAAYAI